MQTAGGFSINTRLQPGAKAELRCCSKCLLEIRSLPELLPARLMKTRSLLGFTFAQCILLTASIATSRADSDKSVTAAQVNGTWKTKDGEFKIWALGKQRLQVEFSGVYEYKTPQGPMANEGEGSGVATIEGKTAIFKPEGAEEECQITLKFTGSKLVVTQTGICGFGHNVSAEGAYKKVSSKKPKFGSD
jgi:hypothetical protein